MRRHVLIPVAFALVTASLSEGCASSSTAGSRVPVTPVSVREAQTRYFEEVDAPTAMKAVIDMLQDGQFTIDRTDSALGVVVGTRSTSTRPSSGQQALKWTAIAFTYGVAALLPWTKSEISQIEAAANVTGVGEGTRVRLTLQRRVLDKRGQLKRIEPLTDPVLYKDLFELLGRSLFIAQGQ